MKELLTLIRRLEAKGNYDIVYSGIPKAQRPAKLTTMTVGEVMAWQDKVVKAGAESSAAGAYQIIRKTLRTLVTQGFSPSDTFNARTQDAMATQLLMGRGLARYMRGEVSAEWFANEVAKEWASLPLVSGKNVGKSYYDGDGLNHALCKPEEYLAAVKAVTAKPATPTKPRPVYPAPKESPAPPVTAAPKKAKPDVAGTVTVATGAAAAVTAAWQEQFVVAAIALAIVVVVVIILKRRKS